MRHHRHYHARQNRRGFELSISFIVILIMTVVIFSSSILVVRKFFIQTDEIQGALSTDAQEQIQQLLGQGQSVAVVPAKVDLDAGKSSVIGLGISNILSAPATFHFVIGFSKAFDENGVELIEVDKDIIQKWVLYKSGPYALARGERDTPIIRVSPGFQIAENLRTSAGTYIFNVCVFQVGKQAGAAELWRQTSEAFEDDRSLREEDCGLVGKPANLGGRSVAQLKPYTQQIHKLQVAIK